MTLNDTRYRLIIITGLLSMTLLETVMLVTDSVEAFLFNDSSFSVHLGMRGLWIQSILIVLSIVAIISTASFDNKKVKTGVFVVSIIVAGFMLFHQVTHMIGGDGFDIHFVFDVLHHVIGVWTIMNAYKYKNLESPSTT